MNAFMWTLFIKIGDTIRMEGMEDVTPLHPSSNLSDLIHPLQCETNLLSNSQIWFDICFHSLLHTPTPPARGEQKCGGVT